MGPGAEGSGRQRGGRKAGKGRKGCGVLQERGEKGEEEWEGNKKGWGRRRREGNQQER